MFVTVNPATGQEVATYPTHDDPSLTHLLARAWEAYGDWRHTGFADRAALFLRLAELLETQVEELASLMVTEMGKPIGAARSEVAKCAWACRHYAEHAEAYLAADPIDVGDDAQQAYVRFDPLGPVLAIMPWNFPFWQLFRAAVPALMAGNTMLLKHSSNVGGCAVRIEELFRDAGAPEGVFTTLLVSGETAGELIADERIRGVTLTGSVPAGRAVAAAAGRALKPCVLELGGSDAFVVLADADLERAAEVGATSRLLNNGESCIAAKRFIVVDAVADEFTDLLADQLRQARVGDPMDEDTDVGPLARADLRDTLDDQVRRAVGDGAQLVLGGTPGDGDGFFYPPTLLTGVEAQTPAGAEELFGPVAAVLTAPDEVSAVALANASDFGLGASVWSRDRERAQQVAADLDAGSVMINQLVKSDPRVPFGGVKDSGFGRELGRYGIREFVNTKTVWVE